MRKLTVLRPLQCHSRFFFAKPQPLFVSPPMEPETYISLIKQCGTIKCLRAVHATMVRSHFHLNLYLSTNLVAQYASLGSISESYALFCDSCDFSDLFLWNVMIRGFVDNGDFSRGLVLYSEMRRFGVEPDKFTFPFVLKACGFLRDVGMVARVHGDVVVFGYESDVFVGNSLINVWGKCGRFECALKVFDKMPWRNVVSWSSMIGACTQNGRYEEGLMLLRRMLGEGITPNRVAILNVMGCVRGENEAYDVCRVVVDHGLDLDQSVQNAAMVTYARCGRIDSARRFFDCTRDKDLVCWTSMIEAYAQADLPVEALELFKRMKLERIVPSPVTLLSVLRACSILSSFVQARTIHGIITRSFVMNHMVLDTAVVDLYVKCGSLEYARKVFDRMGGRSMITWSIMISGYGIHGYGREAIYLFDRMKGSVKPDHVTFVSVLSACSHGGLIDVGWECFNSMVRDFGVTPKTEHYACMVDLLGRAGCLNEAYRFIERMPINPGAGVWGALLGACRVHSNVNLAEIAAKSLFELEADNPGRYVLLSNIYASSGRKTEADRIRAIMKQKKVRKISGHSIIEIKNIVYTFIAGDKSHPDTDTLYSELGKLMDRIQQDGYKPDLRFVTQDVGDDSKEKMLFMHSEKLAIVFGLMNSVPGSVIRIKKNLRVCGDCHTATKFISKVTRRKIIVRDAHRFHHFEDGTCSCRDYW